MLVTGCTGLAGSWLTQALVNAGANVVGLVRDSVPRSRLRETGTLDHINVVWGQLEDYATLERCINEYEVETVFHLAAQTIVGTANNSPISTFEANIRGTWNLLEACRRVARPQQIVVASSDKAYGEHPELPYQETTPLQGRHPYDVSKSCVDLLAQAYAYTYKLPVCITRFGNLFGGGDLNFNRLIPGTIRSVITSERPVIRSDGKPTRDYVYVEDATHAYLLLAKKMADDQAIHGEGFNFSYESPQSAVEVVKTIVKMMERSDLEPLILDTASNEIPHQYLSAGKAHNMLGWKPAFSFSSGLQRSIAWYKEFFQKEATA